MLGLIRWTITMMSLWTAGAVAQEECATDADCMRGKYCYEILKMCADYISCSWYKRQESSRPSRQASQCGECLEGYSASTLTVEPSGEAESCTKDPNVVELKDQSNTAAIWVCGSIVFGILFLCGSLLYVVYVKFPDKFPSHIRPTFKLNKPGLEMAERGNCASMPLAPDSSENIDNDEHNDAGENNPLSTTREYRCNFEVESSHPVKARGFRPPYYVCTDPSYNPEDNQVAETTFSPHDDEETNPSDWTPAPPTGAVIITTVPSAAITQAESDNTTNTVLERIGFPNSSSSSREGHENNRNNGSTSENSGEFESNNTDENRPRNSNSIFIVQMVKLYSNFNQGRKGS